MENTLKKIVLFIVYIKFKFNWISWVVHFSEFDYPKQERTRVKAEEVARGSLRAQSTVGGKDEARVARSSVPWPREDWAPVARQRPPKLLRESIW